MTSKFPIRADASLLVGIAILIAGCSRPGSTAGTSGLKQIDQAALQSMVDATAKELLVPGAVVLLRTPQGDFTAGSGTTELNTTNPPRAGTYFRIASNTKTMTSAVILQLAQENKLSLDDPISKYIPQVPNGDKITIALLLEMRSGLYDYTSDPIVAVLDPAYQRRWLDSLKPEDPAKPKGQKYGYGICQLSWGPNTIYFHGGETVGFNSKISYDPANDMTLIVWTNLPVSLDGQQTANTLWARVLDQIYKVSPLSPSPSPVN